MLQKQNKGFAKFFQTTQKQTKRCLRDSFKLLQTLGTRNPQDSSKLDKTKTKGVYEISNYFKNHPQEVPEIFPNCFKNKKGTRNSFNNYFKNQTQGVLEILSNYFKNQTQDVPEILVNFFKKLDTTGPRDFFNLL